MQAVLLRSNPGAQFHFGQIGLDEKSALNESDIHFHSDTLFSAIINIAANIEPGQVESVIEAFKNRVIVVSSGYFCIEEAGVPLIWFLPKPAHYEQVAPVNEPKRFRNIRFISAGVWESGAFPRRWHEPDFVVLQDQFLLLRSEMSLGMLEAKNAIRIINKTDLPRVTARVPGADDSHFYSTNIQVADNRSLRHPKEGYLFVPELAIHYYFLLDCPDPAFWDTPVGQLLHTCIQLLPDTGIGGERSIGCGYFNSVELRNDFPVLRANKANSFATVSLCSPDSEEDLACFSDYHTVFRGGRPTHQDGELRRVRMMTEGACQPEKEAKGQIVDLSVKDKVHYYRNGMVFNLPVAY